jgi:tryptophan-rich sensory protein
LRAAVVATAATLAVAIAGGLLTDIGPWYLSLRNPAWKPPDWLFGPAWTLIFTLTAVAVVLAWQAASAPAQRAQLLAAVALNAVLNIGWSGLFFALRRPDWALVEVVFLWLSIVLLMVAVKRARPRAVWLLLPYLLWVAFAALLNLAVVQLNAPFGA